MSFGIGTDGFSRHACGVFRPKNASSIPWRMSRTVAVWPSASADPRLRREKPVAPLAAADLFLKRRAARSSSVRNSLFGVPGELSDQIFDVDAPPVDRLVAEQRSMLFVDIRPDDLGHPCSRFHDSIDLDGVVDVGDRIAH